MEDSIDNFKDYLNSIENMEKRNKLESLFKNILRDFPNLETRIAWNQPMFIDHGTYIISFSIAKNHFSVGTEKEAYNKFHKDISKQYSIGKMLFRIGWDEKIDYEMLKNIIKFTIEVKKDCKTFWSK